MNDLVSLHAVVHGTVQGVSFRYHARQAATQIGVTGWVRNLPDRTVETLAVGTREQLDHYYRWLQHGPREAQVDTVDVTWSDKPSQSFESFEISYGNRD